MKDQELLDRLAIRDVVEAWGILRDARDWDNWLELWHDGGVMMTTWGGQATPQEFAAAADRGYANGDRMLHALGGVVSHLAGDRAIAQSKLRIMQRGPVEGVTCDVVCIGRNYDFFERRDGRWAIVLRQPIYERDWISPVTPGEEPRLDPEILARRPDGYARLAYLQEGLGYTIKPDMPTESGPELDALLDQGAAWLRGEPLGWPQT